MDLDLISVIVGAILIDLLLDGDNALVIAAMVRHLPTDRPIPWPQSLTRFRSLTRKFPHWLHRFNANQRNAALQVGILGAMVGRIGLLAIANLVISHPIFRLIGAVYLIQLGARHLGFREEHEGRTHGPTSKGFWGTVLAVELTDVAFSLDNVVALVALSTNLLAVSLGVLFAVVMLRVAAMVCVRIIQRHPVLEPAAYLLIVYLGMQIVLEHYEVFQVDEKTKVLALLGIIALALLYERATPVQPVCRPFLKAGAYVMHLSIVLLDGTIRVAFLPFRALLSLLSRRGGHTEGGEW